MTNSLIRDNVAGYGYQGSTPGGDGSPGGNGAGLYNNSTQVFISNSTIVSNTTGKDYPLGHGGGGAGVFNFSNSFMMIDNSVIANNTAGYCSAGYPSDGPDWRDGDGGGIYNIENLTLNSSIVAGNLAGYSLLDIKTQQSSSVLEQPCSQFQRCTQVSQLMQLVMRREGSQT